MADVTMPQLGETVTEGTITKWFKQVGDQVAEDEVLFEVSTDKVDSEVPSPVSGYVAEIKVPEGDTVDVGAVLAVISDGPPSGGGGEAPAAEAAPAPEPEPEAEPQPQAEEAQPEPEPQPQAEEPEPEPEPAPATASQPSAAPVERQPAAEAAAPAASSSSESKLLSPVVRRLIAEHKLDPSTIKGTGAGGRITRNDVQAVIEATGGARPGPAAASAPAAAPAEDKAPPARPAPAAAAAPASKAPAAEPARAGERDTAIPHSNIRRRTAEHMIRSKQTSAHVYASIEVDYEAVEEVRREKRE